VSHVRWTDPLTQEDFEAWCAWDFTLLPPMHEIRLGKDSSSFHLVSSNIDTNRNAFAAKIQLPELAVGEFMITEGKDDQAATEMLLSIGNFYFENLGRLREIKDAREKYAAAAAKWHAENPPTPQDHTIWLKPHRGSRYLKKKEGK